MRSTATIRFAMLTFVGIVQVSPGIAQADRTDSADIQKDEQYIESQIRRLSIEHQQLDVIRSVLTSFTAGAAVASLANPTNYRGYDNLDDTLQTVLDAAQFQSYQEKKRQVGNLAGRVGRALVRGLGGNFAGAAAEILDPVSQWVTARFAGVRGRQREAMFARLNPGVRFTEPGWNATTRNVQHHVSAAFQFLDERNNVSAALIANADTVLGNTNETRRSVELRLASIARLANVTGISRDSLHRHPEEMIRGLRAKVQESISSAEGISAIRNELRQLTGLPDFTAEVETRYTQTQQFYANAAARVRRGTEIEDVPANLTQRYAQLFPDVAQDIDEAATAFEAAYGNISSPR